MTLSLEDWRQRFLQQASWTHQLRSYLFNRAGLVSASRVLDLGCGPGALFSDVFEQTEAALFGADIDYDYLKFARSSAPKVHLTQADGHNLPYPDGAFDAVMCHFLLLWVADPLRVAFEMRRVTRPGGAVLALAEPDYGGRIDYPPELARLGDWQQESLRRQGADPQIGRRLPAILSQSGLVGVESGVLGGQWQAGDLTDSGWLLEWKVLRYDLAQMQKEIPAAGISSGNLEQEADLLFNVDRQARESGARVLFVPTFYAWGRIPETATGAPV